MRGVAKANLPVQAIVAVLLCLGGVTAVAMAPLPSARPLAQALAGVDVDAPDAAAQAAPHAFLVTCMNPTDKPNLPDLRVSYDQGELDEHSAPADPVELFTHWINDALAHNLPEPNAMSPSGVKPL